MFWGKISSFEFGPKWLWKIFSHRVVVTGSHSRQKSHWLSVSNRQTAQTRADSTHLQTHTPLSMKGWTVCYSLFLPFLFSSNGRWSGRWVHRKKEWKKNDCQISISSTREWRILPLSLFPSYYFWPFCDLSPVHFMPALAESSLPSLMLRRQSLPCWRCSVETCQEATFTVMAPSK